MKTLLAATASIVVLAVAAPALADPTGLYVAADVGYQQAGDMDGTTLTVIPPATITSLAITAEQSGGWQGVARVGYRFSDNWRVEIEGAYRTSDIDTVNGVGGQDGEFTATTLMGNVLYDFGAGNAAFRPFIGAGVGGGQLEYELLNNSDDDTGYAWQLLAGVGWSLTDRVRLDATYRYVQLQEMEVGGLPFYEDSYTNHSVSVGVRYAFGGQR